MKKFLALLISFALIFTIKVDAQIISEEEVDYSPLPVVSELEVGVPLSNVKSAVLIDADSGKILFTENADEKLPPASITKIMSLLLVMEAIENGQFTYETVLTCSDTAAKLGGSQIWLEPGEEMTVNDLIKAVAVVSANDATVLLAEAVAGSEEGFVTLMNSKAKSLGMNSTNFINSTGLDAENHYSSAYDVALMSKELLKHKKITEYTTVWMDTLRNGESQLVSTNKLVRFYNGCTGLKTGTTADAGYCLSASASRDGLNLIAVAMGADTSANRFSACQKLLNFGFANYCNAQINTNENLPETVAVKKGTKRSVHIEKNENYYALIKKNQKEKIKTEVIIPEYVTAPIKKGDKIGELRILCDGEEIGVLSINANEDVYGINIWRSFAILLKYLFTL